MTETQKNPYLREAEIPHASDVEDAPTVSLHLLVKNGSSVVGRLLDGVGEYVHEIVAVLNDCEDDTEAVLRDRAAALGIPFVPVHVTRATHPELYIVDTKRTYMVGRSLSGEEFGGPFTEQPILADWSAARNIGWNLCTGKWRLFLDADDVVVDPECIPGLCKLLDEEHVELLASPYHYSVDSEGRPRGKSFRERLALNKPEIRWANPVHEVLVGTTRVAHLETNLVVRDMRDNAGKDVRIPGRNFKILYHRARTRDWDVSPRLLADLIMEVRHMAPVPGMMQFADALLEKYMEDASWPEERGWVLALVGEMHESLEHLDVAIHHYEESLEIHPGSKTAFRLCRARFKKAVEERRKERGSDPERTGEERGRPDPEGPDLSPPASSLSSLKERGSDPERTGEERGRPDPEGPDLSPPASSLSSLWRGVVSAYETGVANKVVHQALDDGPLYEEMEKIHVAGALLELGETSRALAFVDEALAAFPENSALKQLRKHIELRREREEGEK